MNQKNRGGVLNTPNVSLITEVNSIRCYDPYNGHAYVDLGLPSGLKWATCNVGAVNPQDYGLYFAWGETTGYTLEQITSGEHVFSEDVYNAGPAASILDSNLTLEQDAAHTNMGGNWRMPTKEEFSELINSSYTTQIWTNDYNSTGVKGYVITSKTNGNYIFMPAAGNIPEINTERVNLFGYYWSLEYAIPYYNSYYLYLNKNNIVVNRNSRFPGQSVRGVCD